MKTFDHARLIFYRELNTFSEIEFDFTLTGITTKDAETWFIGGGWRLPKRGNACGTQSKPAAPGNVGITKSALAETLSSEGGVHGKLPTFISLRGIRYRPTKSSVLCGRTTAHW